MIDGKITGRDLIDFGFTPGRHFSAMIDKANEMGGVNAPRPELLRQLSSMVPPPMLKLQDASSTPIIEVNMDYGPSDAEKANYASVLRTMEEVVRTPGVEAATVMPDACPAGPQGTIPVGGVVASRAIHPGMHSADVCCSMAISVFPNASPIDVLDAMHKVTHFGPGGREEFEPSYDLMDKIHLNPVTSSISGKAVSDMGTQGDGNHFAFVGTMKSTGHTALVTHHGSRGFGAMVFKMGMEIAERNRRVVSSDTLKQNAWIAPDTKEEEYYWDALQIVREWTKENHFVLHDALTHTGGHLGKFRASDRFWNEHNFVFRKSDGLFYHAKGATPAFKGWADDATDLTITPLNMAEPILITRGLNTPTSLGFSPHGAGRNYSRTQHKNMNSGRTDADIFAEETRGIDARFFSGETDISELPSAYKNASSVKSQIHKYGLADVVDEVTPFGCIMAGDWDRNVDWRKKRDAKRAAKVSAGTGGLK